MLEPTGGRIVFAERDIIRLRELMALASLLPDMASRYPHEFPAGSANASTSPERSRYRRARRAMLRAPPTPARSSSTGDRGRIARLLGAIVVIPVSAAATP